MFYKFGNLRESIDYMKHLKNEFGFTDNLVQRSIIAYGIGAWFFACLRDYSAVNWKQYAGFLPAANNANIGHEYIIKVSN